MDIIEDIKLQISILEAAAMLTGILGVWLTSKQSKWCFPIGIINVTLYAWLFFSPGVRLYADSLLQVIYILILTYGWIKWTSKNNHVTHPSSIPRKNILPFILTTLTTAFILGYFFSSYTNASLPFLDSTLTAFSLAAQWMIARKYIENWIIWIVTDLIYIPLYLHKNLPLTALLYFIFLILAIKGLNDWKKAKA